MVYVQSQSGQPLMPTVKHCMVRRLLQTGRAVKIKTKPFTIRLTYETTNKTELVRLDVDSGYLNIGLSAKTTTKEVYSAELQMLQGQKQRITERAMYRNHRRSRLRYREPRFDNRRREKGWLAPSIQHKLNTHIRMIHKVCELIPVSYINIEVAAFDIQKINNPETKGTLYQLGNQYGFWNVREYILHRDGHKCQNPNCKNKSKNPILSVHHLDFRKHGATEDSKYLTTLCNHCHTPANHKPGHFLHAWMLQIRYLQNTFLTHL